MADMAKRQKAEVVQALARVGALAQVRELLAMFPDLIDDINKMAPKRRLTPTMRAELVESTNGAAPKLKRQTSTKRKTGTNRGTNPNKRWTAAHRRNFVAAMRKINKAKKAAAREAAAAAAAK
jgi:hypothetical protein